MGVNSLIVKCKFSVKFILPPNARSGAKEQKRYQMRDILSVFHAQKFVPQ